MADPTAPDAGPLPRPASRHALALLRFPDRRTDWVVVMVATLATPVTELQGRLAELHRQVPIVGARFRDEIWHPGAPPAIEVIDGEPVGHPATDRPFDLAHEAPLRVVVGADGRRLALAGHHAAFDGLALVALFTALLGGPLPSPVESPPPGPQGSKWPLLARLLRPASRVAPSATPPTSDRYDTATIELQGPATTGRLAAACATAAGAHNRRRSRAWSKIGITVAKGGPAGVGNVASYRRLDLAPGEPVAPAVVAALATPDEPGEQVNASKALKLLAPVVDRFSDSILVSNLGRHEVPGATRLDFFPVARGRSAVVFAAASVVGGQSSLTIRARDLDQDEAHELLQSAAAALPEFLRLPPEARREAPSRIATQCPGL